MKKVINAKLNKFQKNSKFCESFKNFQNKFQFHTQISLALIDDVYKFQVS